MSIPEPKYNEFGELAPVAIRIKVHDNGPALWPERFDVKRIERIKKVLGAYNFSALYQGAPSPEGGGRFKRSWFKYYTIHDEYIRLDEGRAFKLSHCRRFGCVDLAFAIKKDSDYTVIGAFAVTPDADLLLLDLHRERMTGDQLVPSCRKMIEKWSLAYIGIEDNQAQVLVVQTARKQGLTVRQLKANMDKGERAIPLQVRMEAGQVWFPKSHPELDNLEHELLTFPNGAHDDAVDVLAYAGLQVQREGPAAIPPEERARLDREAAERAWQDKVERDRAAQQDFEHPRWWDDAWSDEGRDFS
jgi:predicted phage terminase large subunit-like protein